jgi:hypothetical protein
VDDVISGGETIKQVQKFKKSLLNYLAKEDSHYTSGTQVTLGLRSSNQRMKIKHMQRRSLVQNQPKQRFSG